jgi:hypothetical protein
MDVIDRFPTIHPDFFEFSSAPSGAGKIGGQVRGSASLHPRLLTRAPLGRFFQSSKKTDFLLFAVFP